MQSIIYYRYGDPADVLQLTERPELREPGNGEVLVRATHRPVRPGDLIGVRGLYRSRGNITPVGPDGAQIGFEGTGTIEAIGPEVSPSSGLVPGARVAFFPARGAWSEKVLVPARFVTLVPDDIAAETAAQLHVNPLTAAMIVRAAEETGLKQGDAVVLTAARSQVAKLTASLLLNKGYFPVGLVRSHISMAAVEGDFAGMPMASTENPEWQEELRTIADRRPIRMVLDPVGGDVLSTVISGMDGGTVISYGDLSGEPIRVPALAFSAGGITITGVSVGRWSNLPDEVRASDLAIALELARSAPGLFRVAAEYDLAQVGLAVSEAERSGKLGTVLLTSKHNVSGGH
ncbi:zinc-binding dehydrogenase [Devosia sp. 1566]|uniref:alcohol dehydrogenase catalytic domain-containing protein n=1 Tax=Devosia sp. 1566 TaxID=2499144 RepID=UPI000FDB5D79|nr:zinc-binding dehydrogenase [Devosia sp. 1566]